MAVPIAQPDSHSYFEKEICVLCLKNIPMYIIFLDILVIVVVSLFILLYGLYVLL